MKLFLTFLLSLVFCASAQAAPTSGGSYAPVAQARLVYSSTNVTTGAWVQLIASVGSLGASAVDVFDCSGQTLKMAWTTDAGSTHHMIQNIYPGGTGFVNTFVPPNARVDLEALSATANTCSIVANFYK